MLDRFNREIYYLRISVTDRCNLRCYYCMPEHGVKRLRHDQILSYEQIIKIVKEAVKIGIKKIRLTGGEPLVRKGISYLIREIKKIDGINELTMTTNGVLLENMAFELKNAGLDRLNISLDTLDPEKYNEITRIGDIRRVFRGIDAVIKAGFKGTKLNMVLIPGKNDDEVEDMKEFCIKKGLLLQRINHYSLNNLNSINRLYEAERPLPCSLCNRIRLTANGNFKPCLFSDLEIPIDFNNIIGTIEKAVINKPANGTHCFKRQNWQIGG
ncbi:molybdenum cofactor biosynthesis protein MoeA [candidate division TA06 bacterium]|uniref:Molybdenum cofactor biosynthesis protein MoeA n=1 Tax=candidate division TA06 bacterium TaxID=2250710 RepID=A0A660SDV4_UNCT6|nr:MAG: molybdenum cofactor biosynthesis protein MoeA [candidate division TA06 bacterium]